MFMNPRLVMSDVADPDARNWILEGLAEANRVHVREPGLRHLIVLIKHPWNGRLLGGFWGRTSWDWLLIELLYVSRDLRGAGWGRRLVEAAEEEAVRRHCRAAWVDSYSFQAPGFYERLGYSVFGKLDDYPQGHQRFFLWKKLSDRIESGTKRT
jgi:GNAT superfamily N-acetyltransferase